MEEKTYLPLIKEALTLIDREYAHYAGVQEIAERLGVTKEHLVRSFRAALGETPGKYLTCVRLENACLYLRGRDYSVDFVAGLCGFSCGNYFDKVFRRAYGMTPLQYRTRYWDENTPAPEAERATFL